MRVRLAVRNLSVRKGLYRRLALTQVADRVCAAERARAGAEISVLLCDDAMIHDLNRRYRNVDKPTDVLSFSQPPPVSRTSEYALGDIVISLETVECRCGAARDKMREEVVFLFCHGLLHLLGYDHATPREEAQMRAKQARYLGITEAEAWRDEPAKPGAARRRLKKED